MPESYTKAELHAGVTASADITTNVSCELKNNGGNTYFSIETVSGGGIFAKGASISNLDKCVVVSGSKNAAFAVNGSSTASFDLNIGGVTIPKENIRFRATNTLASSPGASGYTTSSYFGVDLTYT